MMSLQRRVAVRYLLLPPSHVLGALLQALLCAWTYVAGHALVPAES